jgi:hypothetical protein
MLKPISELPNQDKWNAIVRGWVAVDPDSGAQLSASHGSTSKAPKYILILPNKSVEERGGLFAPYDWDYPHGRKFVRAWTDVEAIELANAKLAKMLQSNG